MNLVTIDLTKIFAISRVIVQGDRNKDGSCGGFTSRLSVMHSNDEKVWVLTRDYNGKDDFKFRNRVIMNISQH